MPPRRPLHAARRAGAGGEDGATTKARDEKEEGRKMGGGGWGLTRRRSLLRGVVAVAVVGVEVGRLSLGILLGWRRGRGR